MQHFYHVFGTITNMATYHETHMYLCSFSSHKALEKYLHTLAEEILYMQENFPDEQEVCGRYTTTSTVYEKQKKKTKTAYHK